MEGESGGQIDRLLQEMVAGAVADGASDVHIEPQEDGSRIRFRIDGRLRTVRELARELHGALLLRLKILSNIPVDCPQLPQDGKWTFANGEERRDIRVSLVPFSRGEGAVLRILMGFTLPPSLGELGFDESTAAQLTAAVRGPDGLLLLTGPTGCGKSTTVHALLAGLNDGSRKIITVEDPVEYAIDGISSVQVNGARGLSFASALRSVLRQSPNVLFVGEIRDEETAAVAIQAALTGHFVCSTLHCPDAAGAIPRLMELKIPLHLIRAVLRGVLSQRLVRCLCERCRQPHGGGLRDLLGRESESFRPVGCDRCGHSGYRGQTAIYEWLPLNSEKTDGNFLEELPEKIAISLRECAMGKVAAAVTSPEEVYAATGFPFR
ncbi:MAG: GspE/PulE family protein [Puniceicoccales bacterium]|jgi:general secretion pathway protein E|nr:GspE/PulE family protein [Puniceicoccales bacterium]